jgi:predicted nucleic acid-binding protein
MKLFFDTNVLLYSTDDAEPAKQRRARQWLDEAVRAGSLVVSTQVLIELFANLVRKQRTPRPVAERAVAFYAAGPVVETDVSLLVTATAHSVRWQLSIFDALIVAAAQRAKADVLLSEDFQPGQRFDGLTVFDPFAGPSESAA